MFSKSFFCVCWLSDFIDVQHVRYCQIQSPLTLKEKAMIACAASDDMKWSH